MFGKAVYKIIQFEKKNQGKSEGKIALIAGVSRDMVERVIVSGISVFLSDLEKMAAFCLWDFTVLSNEKRNCYGCQQK